MLRVCIASAIEPTSNPRDDAKELLLAYVRDLEDVFEGNAI